MSYPAFREPKYRGVRRASGVLTVGVGNRVPLREWLALASRSPEHGPNWAVVKLPVIACEVEGEDGTAVPSVPSMVESTVRESVAGSVDAYSNGELVVLGPKGWRCFGWRDASGSGMEIVPSSMEERPVEHRGEAIVVQRWSGGASGRSEVVRIGTPLFPKLAARVESQRKAADADEDEKIRMEPWDGEEVHTPERNEAWFMDGPNAEGSGTLTTGLAASSLPIGGAVRLLTMAPGEAGDQLPDLTLIAVRLGPDRNPLVSEIISDWTSRR